MSACLRSLALAAVAGTCGDVRLSTRDYPRAFLTHSLGCYCARVGKAMAQQRTQADDGPIRSDLRILHHVTTVTDVSPEAKERLARSLSLRVCLPSQLTGRKLRLCGSARV